ncbi:hypothetical protein A4D02_05280 [Niastella koreensis]|uniref:Uncharacterized protein n=2 Tax=Niastella koreensis TaxID=354356 RepID=A0ABX3NVT3_9BACT|nr:hypothetical protein A4D02_05280 [Niastella koreensis]
MDCFTTRCGSCRYMRTTIFPQAEMGSFFNDKFVSIEVQLDSTSKDNEQVKSWYADAHAQQKAVNASPENERPGYQSTLDKMKKGEKTWN